jgi:polyhydroxyalkanoate synthesis regulator phasin
VEAVRRAVERTVQTTVGSAGLTRDRAQEVVDEVVTRAERTRGAAAGVSDRVREALHDLRQMTGDEMKDLRTAIERLANQVESLESRLESATGIRRPGRSTPARKRSATTKRSGTMKSGGAKKKRTTAKKSAGTRRASTSTNSRKARSRSAKRKAPAGRSRSGSARASRSR